MQRLNGVVFQEDPDQLKTVYVFSEKHFSE